MEENAPTVRRDVLVFLKTYQTPSFSLMLYSYLRLWEFSATSVLTI